MLRSLDPTYPLFPILSCLGFVCSLIPLPWHLQAWNAGTCAFMIWTASYCFVTFVNSLIWAGNVDNVAPVWCDISTQIILGAAVGIPASTLCISRRLYTITAVRTATVTREDKRRAVIGDLCIAVGIPILVLIMHIAVQPHRFDIFEDVGCYPVTYNTLATYFLYLMWPVLIGVVSFTYSFRTLKSFWIRRAQFSELVSSNSAMNPSRYFRLMLLAVIDMMFTVPLGVYTIYNGTHGLPLNPWISWEDTHFDFGRVGLFPTMMWRSNINAELGVELTRWISVFSAVVFFSLFGFAAEARKHYRMAFLWVAKWFGYTPTVKKPVSKSLPRYVAFLMHNISSDYFLIPVGWSLLNRRHHQIHRPCILRVRNAQKIRGIPLLLPLGTWISTLTRRTSRSSLVYLLQRLSFHYMGPTKI
ncbi:STE3-like pheromone receptor [Mycena floridula]|nr:STE3-like pheromone receptor [Mycena floridula]